MTKNQMETSNMKGCYSRQERQTSKNVNILNFISTFQLTCSHLQEIMKMILHMFKFI